MRADVIDVFRGKIAVLQCRPHSSGWYLALWMRGSHMVSITSQPVPCYLTINTRTARRCMVFSLEQQHGCALAWNHALTVTVKRLAELGCNSSQTGESGVGNPRKRICSSSQHEVSLPSAENVGSVGNGIIACRPCCGYHHRLTCQPPFPPNVAPPPSARLPPQDFP